MVERMIGAKITSVPEILVNFVVVVERLVSTRRRTVNRETLSTLSLVFTWIYGEGKWKERKFLQ